MILVSVEAEVRRANPHGMALRLSPPPEAIDGNACDSHSWLFTDDFGEPLPRLSEPAGGQRRGPGQTDLWSESGLR